jgi:zinc transport system ATP-binding protein
LENNTEPILKVSDLSIRLQDQTILENINFELRRGTTLAVMGPNGAGKTMLFKALLNLVPHTGKVEWAKKVKVGYVPQNISAVDIPVSVKEFLSFRNGQNIEECLAAVRLDSKNIRDKGLGTLSGGQLRRVLIAWALIDGPNVLLFDEPTTGVDLDSEEPIYRMLNDLKKRTMITMLLITHDVHIVREYSDYVLALNKCLTFFGESKEIMNPQVQKYIYGETVCVRAESHD